MELYKNIKNRRLQLGLTQEELARKIGYRSTSTIAKIERGVNDIPQSKIKAFADALNTTPGELMGEVKGSSQAMLFDQIAHLNEPVNSNDPSEVLLNDILENWNNLTIVKKEIIGFILELEEVDVKILLTIAQKMASCTKNND